MNERRVALRQTATGTLCRAGRVGGDDLDSAGDTRAATAVEAAVSAATH
jgi:hypothetical protein